MSRFFSISIKHVSNWRDGHKHAPSEHLKAHDPKRPVVNCDREPHVVCLFQVWPWRGGFKRLPHLLRGGLCWEWSPVPVYNQFRLESHIALNVRRSTFGDCAGTHQIIRSSAHRVCPYRSGSALVISKHYDYDYVTKSNSALCERTNSMLTMTKRSRIKALEPVV